MYSDYCLASIKDKWKFYLFNFISKTLFETYKEEVSTNSMESFVGSVEKWTDNRLSLSNLRHQTFENMRDISRKTVIMTNPASLPEEALASISDSVDVSGSASICHSSSGSGRMEPVASPPPPSSGVKRLSTSDAHHLSVPVVSAAAACNSRLSVTAAPPTASVSQLSVQVISASSSCKRTDPPRVHASKSLGLSSSGGSVLSTPVTSTPLSSCTAAQSAARPAVPTFAMPSLFSSLPSTQPHNPPLLSFIPVVTDPQRLNPPQFSPPDCKVSASVKDEGQGQNHYHLSKQLAHSLSRKRTSEASGSGTISERGAVGNELQPVIRRRESLDLSAVAQPSPVSPVRVFVPAQPESQQPIGALQVDMSDISQLAASVEGTSLYVNPPVAVVTPILTHQEPSGVAHLITGSQYIEYDFDITDIPLLDL